MDFEKFINSKIYAIFDKIYHFIMINIIWFLSVVLGFGVFTFMPATQAIFVMQNSMIQEKDVPIFKAYWAILKKDYWKNQKIFIIFFLLGVILFFDVKMYYDQLLDNPNMFNRIGFWVSCLFVLIFIITFINIFMVNLYFPEWKTFKKIKYAFMFAIALPLRSFIVLAISVTSIFIVLWYQFLLPLIFLVLASLLAYITIKVMKPKYDKLLKERKSLIVTDYLN